jgi:hypothetical protein
LTVKAAVKTFVDQSTVFPEAIESNTRATQNGGSKTDPTTGEFAKTLQVGVVD